jgi:hypothetical protein
MLLSEFSPSMPTSLLALLITLGSILRSRLDLQLEILALRHQIGVLERSVHKRPRLTSTDRLLWVSLSGFWRHWRSALLIVKPETVVAWHRKGFRLFWSWKVRHGQQGRPAISRQTRDLIRRMCRENPTWGAPRIHGELLKLSIDIGEKRAAERCCAVPPFRRETRNAKGWARDPKQHRRLLAGVDETHAIPLVLERPRNVEGLPSTLLALIRSCGRADTPGIQLRTRENAGVAGPARD